MDVEVLDTPDLALEAAQADPGFEERGRVTCCRAPGPHAVLPARLLHRPGPAGLARGEGALRGGASRRAAVVFTRREDLEPGPAAAVRARHRQPRAPGAGGRVQGPLLRLTTGAADGEREAQVGELMGLVVELVRTHDGPPYTNDVYRLAQTPGG